MQFLGSILLQVVLWPYLASQVPPEVVTPTPMKSIIIFLHTPCRGLVNAIHCISARFRDVFSILYRLLPQAMPRLCCFPIQRRLSRLLNLARPRAQRFPLVFTVELSLRQSLHGSPTHEIHKSWRRIKRATRCPFVPFLHPPCCCSYIAGGGQ